MMSKKEFDKTTRKRIKEMAQWLREAFPKEYKMAPYNMTLDTRPAENPQEFMIILHDDQHKLLYPVPVSTMKHILSHISILEQKGLKEFDGAELIDLSFKESETIVNYSEIKHNDET